MDINVNVKVDTRCRSSHPVNDIRKPNKQEIATNKDDEYDSGRNFCSNSVEPAVNIGTLRALFSSTRSAVVKLVKDA